MPPLLTTSFPCAGERDATTPDLVFLTTAEPLKWNREFTLPPRPVSPCQLPEGRAGRSYSASCQDPDSRGYSAITLPLGGLAELSPRGTSPGSIAIYRDRCRPPRRPHPLPGAAPLAGRKQGSPPQSLPGDNRSPPSRGTRYFWY